MRVSRSRFNIPRHFFKTLCAMTKLFFSVELNSSFLGNRQIEDIFQSRMVVVSYSFGVIRIHVERNNVVWRILIFFLLHLPPKNKTFSSLNSISTREFPLCLFHLLYRHTGKFFQKRKFKKRMFCEFSFSRAMFIDVDDGR